MFFHGKVFQLLCLIVVVISVTAAIRPSALNTANLRQILNNITVAGIFVCGVSPLLMSGSIDFSGSALGNIGGLVLAAVLSSIPGIPWPIAVVIALISGAILGLGNAFFVVKLNLVPFIATMGFGAAVTALGVWSVVSIPIPITVTAFTRLSAVFVFNVVPLFFVVVLAFVILYSIILNRTGFGRSVLMCGGNSYAARLAGLNPGKIKTILFVNSGLISALAGVIYASQSRFGNPNSFSTSIPHMTAFIASILGGVSFFGGSGSLIGAFFGVALMNLLAYSLQSMGANLWINGLINGLLLIKALTIDDVSRRIRLRKMGIKASPTNMGMPGMHR